MSRLVINRRTREELLEHKARIESSLRAGLDEGLTGLDLRDLNKLGLLTPEEKNQLDEIRRLDFLLGLGK